MTVAARIAPVPVRIPIGPWRSLDADVAIPRNAKSLVAFVHGCGSNRHSLRNQHVASELNALDIATLLADLLTPEEKALDERSGAFRYDVPFLTRRVVEIIDWTGARNVLSSLPLGLFGASTGAAAARDAAAIRPDAASAVVSRGGRPDLAGHLVLVSAPTLLIVGGYDTGVLELNYEAVQKLPSEKKLRVVPGASHLFSEPGALEAVASLAGAWFEKHLHAKK
jgi:putative phosphoribosyl transferase